MSENRELGGAGAEEGDEDDEIRTWKIRMMMLRPLLESKRWTGRLCEYLLPSVRAVLIVRVYMILERMMADRRLRYRPMRTYNLYITYTPYYRTPRFYLATFHHLSR